MIDAQALGTSALGLQLRTSVAKRSTKSCRNFSRAFVGDVVLIVDQVGLELHIGFAAEQRHAKAEHDRAQIRLHQRGADRAGDVPVMNPGLPGQLLLPHGRAPQSMAFLSAVGIERLCSGVTINTPSALATSSLKRTTSARKVAFMVLVVHRQVVDADQFGVEFAGAELDQRQSELAIDRIAAVGADDNGDLGQVWAWLNTSVRIRN